MLITYPVCFPSFCLPTFLHSARLGTYRTYQIVSHLPKDFPNDLRYVLVTSYEPLRAYVYREGLVRFACRPYSKDPEHLSDAYRHLTNYSINKGSATFVENSEVQADNVGHKWSFSALNRHLKCTGVDVELMWSRIMDVIMKSLLAVEPVIGARTKATACHSHNCFELYGFLVWRMDVSHAYCLVYVWSFIVFVLFLPSCCT